MGYQFDTSYYEETPLPDIDKSIERIREICDNTSELMVNEIVVSGRRIALLGCEGMISTDISTQLIIRPLCSIDIGECTADELYNHIMGHMIMSYDRINVENYGDMFRTLNSGFAILLIDGASKILAFGVQGYDKRGVGEPTSEVNVLGSNDSFVEIIRTNMSLVRRRIKSPALKLELFVKGNRSQTDMCLCYMRDRVPQKLIKKIKKSLDNVNLDSVLSNGYIMPFLQKNTNSFFNTIGTTERPDILASKLIEGRVGLMIEGTPFVLIIPHFFTDNFQTLDDYNFKPYYSTYIRWIKYLAFSFSMLLPSIYVAIAMHHPEMLNQTLLLILAEAEANAPFSIISEMIIVLIMYEIVKEAGLRLPKSIGGAVSIVAGLIIGDAAVKSGLISTPLLTIAAIAVLGGYVIPAYNPYLSVIRIMFVLAGGFMGLFGISLMLAIIIFNMCGCENFGYPLTSPISPFYKSSMRDIITRVSFKKMQNGGFTVEQIGDKTKSIDEK